MVLLSLYDHMPCSWWDCLFCWPLHPSQKCHPLIQSKCYISLGDQNLPSSCLFPSTRRAANTAAMLRLLKLRKMSCFRFYDLQKMFSNNKVKVVVSKNSCGCFGYISVFCITLTAWWQKAETKTSVLVFYLTDCWYQSIRGRRMFIKWKLLFSLPVRSKPRSEVAVLQFIFCKTLFSTLYQLLRLISKLNLPQ